jgi:hypothetical protein
LTTCESIKSLLDKSLTDANSKASKLYEFLKGFDPNQYVSSTGFNLDDYNALAEQMRNLESDAQGNSTDIQHSQYVLQMSRCAEIVKAATDLPNKLPQHLDPPIDSVLHSLTFVISYGANITPSWTLLQWKGPGQTANFAAASGVRTHGLVISMGPRVGEPAIGPDPLRLIQLQAIRSINQQ